MKKNVFILQACLILGMLLISGCAELDDIKAQIDFNLNPSQATIDSLNKGIDTLDSQPGKWQSVGDELIGQMGYTTNDVVKETLSGIKTTTGELAGMTSGTVQCRTDSVGVRFRNYLKKVRHDLDAKYPLPPADPPAVCHFTVDKSEDALTYIDRQSSFVHYYGYDFAGYAKRNNFSAAIVYGDTGQIIKIFSAVPNVATNYELIADIQGITNNDQFWNSLDKNRSPRLLLKWGNDNVALDSSDNPNDPQRSEIPLKVTSVVLPSVASFTAHPESGVAPLKVTFTDTSSNADSRKWNLGEPDISTMNKTVTWTYQKPGKYHVVLTVYNSKRESGTTSRDIVVTEKTVRTVQHIPGSNTNCEQVCTSKNMKALSPGNWTTTVIPGLGQRITHSEPFYYCSFSAFNTGIRAGYNVGTECTIGWDNDGYKDSSFNCVCLPEGVVSIHETAVNGNCDTTCKNKGNGWSAIASGMYKQNPMYYCAKDVHGEGLRPGYNIEGQCTVEYDNNEESFNTFSCPCIMDITGIIGDNPPRLCIGGTAKCNDSCVDLQTDRNNCGFCGRACPTPQICETGKCCMQMINPLNRTITKVCS
jgi:PKD repeat protein